MDKAMLDVAATGHDRHRGKSSGVKNVAFKVQQDMCRSMQGVSSQIWYLPKTICLLVYKHCIPVYAHCGHDNVRVDIAMQCLVWL